MKSSWRTLANPCCVLSVYIIGIPCFRLMLSPAKLNEPWMISSGSGSALEVPCDPSLMTVKSTGHVLKRLTQKDKSLTLYLQP